MCKYTGNKTTAPHDCSEKLNVRYDSLINYDTYYAGSAYKIDGLKDVPPVKVKNRIFVAVEDYDALLEKYESMTINEDLKKTNPEDNQAKENTDDISNNPNFASVSAYSALYTLLLAKEKQYNSLLEQFDSIKSTIATSKFDTLTSALTAVLNKFCVDNSCNTPDFILADYLVNCLTTYNRISTWNKKWHSVEGVPAHERETGPGGKII